MNKYRFITPTLSRVSTKAGRCYALPDGRLVPGVTTALDVIAKPALLFWAASEERKHCVENACATFAEVIDSDLVINGEGISQPKLTPQFRQRLEAKIGRSYAHVRKTQHAADIGTEAHAAIERWVRERLGQPVGPIPMLSDAAQLAFMAFEDWAKSVHLEVLGAEVMVYDPWLGYAGTLDFVGRVNGVLSVIDWKTAKAIYPEAILQNAAYTSALRKQCRLGDEPMQGVIVRFPKELADVKEQPFEAKVIPPEDHKPNFYAFLKALDLFNYLHPQATMPTPPAPVNAAPRPQPVPPVPDRYPGAINRPRQPVSQPAPWRQPSRRPAQPARR